MKAYPEDDIDFTYCPECGGSIQRGGMFTSMGMVLSGKNGRCSDCGKEWHVIWDNYEDWLDQQEEE